MDMDEVSLPDASATGSDLGNESGENTMSTKEKENEIKELGIAFKAPAAVVNEALVQNKHAWKALNHRVDEIQTTLVNIQQTIGQRGLLNSTSDLTNPKDATATKVSQSVSPDTIIPTDILKTLDVVKNMVVDLSDDDDTTDGKTKNKGHEPGDKTDVHWGGKFNTSNQPSPTQGLVSVFRKEKTSEIVKKLKHSPTPSLRPVKAPKVEAISTPWSKMKMQNVGKGKNTATVGKEKNSESEAYLVEKTKESPGGHLLPEEIKSKFRPEEGMYLEMAEMIMAAYVFHPDLDDNEILLQIGNRKVRRSDFQCLCPGNEVTQEIITLMTIKITYMQHEAANPTVWALPPTFVEDVYNGLSLPELTNNYCGIWMKPFSGLKFVYVPIRDQRSHWFLMVISTADRKVYQVDSNLEVSDMIKRNEIMVILTAAISQLVTKESGYPTHLVNIAKNMTSWEMLEVRGIPNKGKSDDSAVWVLDWLQLEDGFTSHLYGDLAENSVRMHTATDLIRGIHNEERRAMEEKSEAYWHHLNDEMNK